MNNIKTKFVLIALTILLLGTLTACSEGDTTLEDYLELETVFFALKNEREATLTSEARIEFPTERNAVLYWNVTQIRTDGFDESIERRLVLDRRGTEIANLEAIIIYDSGYIDIYSIMSRVLYYMFTGDGGPEMLELLGLSLDDLSHADILGGSYTHMQFADENFQKLQEERQDRLDSWTGLYRAFDEETLDDYLSRDGDVFRIEVRGEAVYAYIAAALEDINLDDPDFLLDFFEMVTHLDAEIVAALDGDFAAWLRSADLEDAKLIVERTQVDENTFHQNIELYIPEHVSITMDATLVVGESTRISAPRRFLTEAELETRLEAWLIGLVSTVNPVGEQDFALVGTWIWNDDDSFVYVFEANGRGSRGFTGNIYTFDWELAPGSILVLSDGPFSERWLYTIDGDVLTISSMDTPGTIFSYTRIDSASSPTPAPPLTPAPPPAPAPLTPPPQAPPPTITAPTESQLVGTWECLDTTAPHLWFCKLVFEADGRFTDGDGDTGTFRVSGNYIILNFDLFDPVTLTAYFEGDVLVIYVSGFEAELHRR